ncbi:MAG: hypothetical protein R3332_10630 [Pseudohongiellaceae bacterium]|nr:hypothetical protein [Pseudohongiellaceae bacterium]
MKRTISASLALLAMVSLSSFAATPTTVGLFYRSASGNVALVPNVTRRENVLSAPQFLQLGESGAHQLRKQDKYWFVVNHRVSGPTEISYLGVEIIKIMNIPLGSPLYLIRNKNWTRSNDPDFDGSKADSRTFTGITQTDFYELHERESQLSNFDAALEGFKWHARPNGASEDSWSRRSLWLPTFDVLSEDFHSRFDPPIEQNANLLLDARLLRFSTTNKLNTENPVVFDVTGANTEAVYIKIFSPDAPEFDRVYFLTFH